MKQLTSLFLVTFILLLSLLFSGCYRFNLSSIPSHIKSFNINLLENKTTKPSLNIEVKSIVTDSIRQRSSLILTTNRAHSSLNLVLNSYDNSENNLSGNQITSREIKISAQVAFIDNIKQDTLFYEENLIGYSVYSIVNGETESDGRQQAVENLAQLIVENTILGW